MNFSEALFDIKGGKKLTRKHWVNASYVFLVAGSEFKVSRPPLLGFFPEGTDITYRPHIDMVAKDGTVGTWSPSMHDVLAEDWEVVS